MLKGCAVGAELKAGRFRWPTGWGNLVNNDTSRPLDGSIPLRGKFSAADFGSASVSRIAVRIAVCIGAVLVAGHQGKPDRVHGPRWATGAVIRIYCHSP